MNRINRFISAVSGILVLVLTGAALVLSCHALSDLALTAGVIGKNNIHFLTVFAI